MSFAGLARDYSEDKAIRWSFYVKVAIVIPGIIAIIILACLMRKCDDRTPPGGSNYIYCNGPDSAAASLEWFVAALFCLYIFSMVFDMYPSRFTSTHRRNHAVPQDLIQPTRGQIQPKLGLFGKKHNKHPHGPAATTPSGTMTSGPNGQAAAFPAGGNSMV